MNSGISKDGSDSAPLYTLAMFIVLGCILASSVVWFAVDGMKATATSAIATVAAQKGAISTGGTNANAKTITFSLGGQSFSRESMGDVNSQIVIAEFSDYQCPYCMQANPTIKQLEEKYAGKVQVVHMNFVVHSGARLAALASECAGEQGKYWAMHDAIFEQQKYDKTGLEQTANSIGLDAASFSTCLSSGKHENTIDAHQTAGESVGIDGTPTFLIGKIKNGVLSGKTVVGALPLSSFESEVNAAMNS